jgi:shikimate dehydrogenase
MNLSGATRLAAVIGDPIRHSRSPAIFNAAFAAAGLDWAYLAFEVPAGGAAGALDAVRALGIEGLSVTMPHKSDVAELVDECSPQAERLGAVNCVVRRGDRLVGHNTDVAGFVASLRADAGFDPAGRRCVVLGAGGAACCRARPGRGRGVRRRGREPLARQGGDRGRWPGRGIDGPRPPTWLRP